MTEFKQSNVIRATYPRILQETTSFSFICQKINKMYGFGLSCLYSLTHAEYRLQFVTENKNWLNSCYLGTCLSKALEWENWLAIDLPLDWQGRKYRPALVVAHFIALHSLSFPAKNGNLYDRSNVGEEGRLEEINKEALSSFQVTPPKKNPMNKPRF